MRAALVHCICETSRKGYHGSRPSPLCIEVFLHDWTERIDSNVIEAGFADRGVKLISLVGLFRPFITAYGIMH